jgi:leukotriene-A4 hydrolase
MRRRARNLDARMSTPPALDEHSFSEPGRVIVRHLDLDLTVQFERRTLEGVATLTVERSSQYPTGPLTLDTRALTIHRVETADRDAPYREVPFEVGAIDPILGAPLTIDLPERVQRVRVRYSTSPDSTALQWLEPAQTAGKMRPFLFTQSQSIHARSWIPLQDSPGVRFTYSARVHQPDGLLALMSAENNAEVCSHESSSFRMTRPIPPYLIALAVGDLALASTGPRTAVYAEPEVIARAAYEFGETERILAVAETLFGAYPWSRFDILVLPPSFPFGGMENPELIFVTPTLLAGDRSSVSVIAHELAHAWSGNLVTNATWRDFWLNEGFTTYLEYRLQERLYGEQRAAIEQVLDQRRLAAEIARLDERDQVLHIDLAGRSPDDAVTRVPYVKGALFLKALEGAFGREPFDRVLRGYFAHFAFQSVTTAQVMAYLWEHLIDRHPQLGGDIDIDEWISAPGLPAGAPLSVSDVLTQIEKAAQQWSRGLVRADELQAGNWTAQEWLHFLKSLPSQLSVAQMTELDASFKLTEARNAEILQQWLLMAVCSGYKVAYPRLEEFLLSVGRRLFVKPLYEELAKTEDGKKFARSVYTTARSLYHPITQTAIDRIIGV